ncbi:site-specific integrase [Trichocoleus sp. FACHB-46]|nr:site-specific integrase [Trichocoleus sp. FACHB-46]
MKVDGHGQAKILTPYEIAKLFESFEGDRDRALFGTCLYTGCRINEACSVLIPDAYDSRGVRTKIMIRKSHTKGQQETRQVPVNSVLKGYLEAYWAMVGKQYLFPGRHGRGYINPKSADEILREKCDRLGLVGVSTHSFRRTALTQMHNAGVPLRVIQKISGHRSLQSLQQYLEVSELQLEGAIAALSF